MELRYSPLQLVSSARGFKRIGLKYIKLPWEGCFCCFLAFCQFTVLKSNAPQKQQKWFKAGASYLGLILLFQFFMWIRNIINLTSKYSTSCNIIFIPLLYDPPCTHFCMTSIGLLPAVLSQGIDTQRYQSFNIDCASPDWCH